MRKPRAKNSIYSKTLEMNDIILALTNFYETEGLWAAVEYAEKMVEQKKLFIKDWEKLYNAECNGENRPKVLNYAKTRIKNTEHMIMLLEDYVEDNKKRYGDEMVRKI